MLNYIPGTARIYKKERLDLSGSSIAVTTIIENHLKANDSNYGNQLLLNNHQHQQQQQQQSSNNNESCKLCGKNVANIKKHMKSHFPDKYQCHICMISLTRSDNLKRHIKLKHGIREGSIMSPFMRLESKHLLPKKHNERSTFLT